MALRTASAPPRNLDAGAVLRAAGPMTDAARRILPALALTGLLSVVAPGDAEARASVYVGIGPVYPWAYPYPYPWGYYPPAVVYPVPSPPLALPAVPPPGWVPGRWERRYDPAGRPYDVWIPTHLR
jgi:hypothetical protein